MNETNILKETMF